MWNSANQHHACNCTHLYSASLYSQFRLQLCNNCHREFVQRTADAFPYGTLIAHSVFCEKTDASHTKRHIFCNGVISVGSSISVQIVLDIQRQSEIVAALMLLSPACTQGMQTICWHRVCPERKALEALTKLKHCEMSITNVDYSVECHFDCYVQSLLVQLGKTPLSFPPVVQAAQLQQDCFLFSDALDCNPVVSPHTQSLVLSRPGWQVTFLKHALSLRIQTSCRPQQCCLESVVSGSRQIEVCCSEAILWCAATPRLPRLHSSNCTCKETL